MYETCIKSIWIINIPLKAVHILVYEFCIKYAIFNYLRLLLFVTCLKFICKLEYLSAFLAILKFYDKRYIRGDFIFFLMLAIPPFLNVHYPYIFYHLFYFYLFFFPWFDLTIQLRVIFFYSKRRLKSHIRILKLK